MPSLHFLHWLKVEAEQWHCVALFSFVVLFWRPKQNISCLTAEAGVRLKTKELEGQEVVWVLPVLENV